MYGITLTIHEREIEVSLLSDKLESLRNQLAITANEQHAERLQVEIREVTAELFRTMHLPLVKAVLSQLT